MGFTDPAELQQLRISKQGPTRDGPTESQGLQLLYSKDFNRGKLSKDFFMEDEASSFYGSSINSLLFPTPTKNECGLFFPVKFSWQL
jgi:hypothetical protein